MPDPILLGTGVTALLDALSPAVANYADAAPQGARAPYVIHQKIGRSGEQWESFRGPSTVADATVQISIHAATKAEAEVLAGRVRQALNGYKGTTGGVTIRAARLLNEIAAREDLSDPKLFVINQDYLIIHVES